MKVGDSVRLAINSWTDGEQEAAMLHACNSVDGTASKVHPSLRSTERFTRLLRDSYQAFGPMALPGINVEETRWPVRVRHRPKTTDGRPDIADVIWAIHRCTHGHGDELPDGFELLAHAADPARYTEIGIEKGKVRLSDRVIFGLVGVAILQPVNGDQSVPAGYYLTFEDDRFEINEWWGRYDAFVRVISGRIGPYVKLDFGDWMSGI